METSNSYSSIRYRTITDYGWLYGNIEGIGYRRMEKRSTKTSTLRPNKA